MNAVNIKQRSDLTYKHNTTNGRHGWLRLTPAYSVNVVNEILKSRPEGTRVLDPFSGTATTPLCASYKGFESTSVDINPFLVWLGKAKVTLFEQADLDATYDLALQIIEAIAQDTLELSPLPPLYNIERWWDTDELHFLQGLKFGINALVQEGSQSQTLLLMAFCRTMIRTSKASFNHQSMSFKEEDTTVVQLSLSTDNSVSALFEMFREDIGYILKSAAMNPVRAAEVLLGDSRNPGDSLIEQYDLVITSPPYPNRMSYIRELRPYMYWLDYLSDAREAGELDWRAIGGTWGIATSRLLDWNCRQDTYYPSYLKDALARVSSTENRNGRLLSIYISKYFEDIWSHLRNLVPLISPGGELHYIIGNSTFYDVLIPVERIYRDMMLELGFIDVTVNILRKRNSKKDLFEYRVSGRKR